MKYILLGIGIIMAITLLSTEMADHKLEGALLAITGMLLYYGFKIANSKKPDDYGSE